MATLRLLRVRWTTVWSFLVILAGAVFLSRNHADPDFWGHVQYGRDVLRNGLPLTATYSYTAINYRWINHENLSEIIFAWVVDHWGVPALLFMKALSGAALTGILWFRLRHRGLTPLVATVVLLAGLANVMFFWTLRPQWFTLTLFVVLLALLDDKSSQAGRSLGTSSGAQLTEGRRMLRRLLWIAPGVFLVWANFHGGFVLGLVFLAAYLGLRSCQWALSFRRAGIVLASQAAVVLLLCVASTLVNPYGWELHRWLRYSLGAARPEIAEWHPPRLLDPVFTPWWVFLGFSAIVGALTWRRRDWLRSVMLVLFAWQPLLHLRHIPFYTLAFLWWCAEDTAIVWNGFMRRFGIRARLAPAADNPPLWLWIAAGAVAVGLIGLLVSQVGVIPVHREQYPVDCVQYIARQGLDGRMVARFDWAQYVLETFAHGPKDRPVTLAVDGRFRTCYPRSVLDAYFDFAQGDDPACRNRAPNSPPFDPTRILRMGNPDLVLIGCDERQPGRILREHARDWTLLYRDGVAELWGRRSRYDDPKRPDYVASEQRLLNVPKPHGFVPWPAHPDWTQGNNTR